MCDMDISNLVCISRVIGVYESWYFNIGDQQYSYITHNPLTTRRMQISAFTKLSRVFDDGVTVEDVRIEQYLPLDQDPEKGIQKFFKIAVLA